MTAPPTTDQGAAEQRTAAGRWWAMWVAVAWTAFVWVGRIRNALADDAIDGAEARRAFLLSALFLAIALPVPLVWWWERRRPGPRSGLRVLVVANLVVAIGVWGWRIAGILGGGHDVGFVVVHVVLGVVSAGTWAIAVATLPAPSAAGSGDTNH